MRCRARADRRRGRRCGKAPTLSLPPAKITALSAEDIDELEAIIGQRVVREVAPAIVDVGAIWIVAQLADVDSLLALPPDFQCSAAFEKRLGVTGLSLFGRHADGEAAIEVRSFAPSCGVEEDLVCGSGNGAIAVFHRDRGLLPEAATSYTAAQGRCVGRDGRIALAIDADGGIGFGGACVTCVDGKIAR